MSGGMARSPWACIQCQATKPETERQGVMAERYMEDKTISLKCNAIAFTF